MRWLVAVGATAALVSGGVVAGETAAFADSGSRVVSVVGTASGVTVSRATVAAGRITFKVSTAGEGSQITLFRLAPGVSADQFFADLREEFSPDPATAAKGTRDLVRDARFFGLADVVPGYPATVTEVLRAGTYYLVDVGPLFAGVTPTLTRLTVTGRADVKGADGENGEGSSVLLTSDDRFVAPRVLPARGSVRVRNVADTIHFMAMAPVKPGTTDAEVQAYFDSGSQEPPPFAIDGPSIGLDVISPGVRVRFSYNLPPGTYVLLCFIADDVTGIPHAVMGMHKVVTLRGSHNETGQAGGPAQASRRAWLARHA